MKPPSMHSGCLSTKVFWGRPCVPIGQIRVKNMRNRFSNANSPTYQNRESTVLKKSPAILSQMDHLLSGMINISSDLTLRRFGLSFSFAGIWAAWPEMRLPLSAKTAFKAGGLGQLDCSHVHTFGGLPLTLLRQCQRYATRINLPDMRIK